MNGFLPYTDRLGRASHVDTAKSRGFPGEEGERGKGGGEGATTYQFHPALSFKTASGKLAEAFTGSVGDFRVTLVV